MSNSQTSLGTHNLKTYGKMTDAQKFNFLNDLYNTNNLSWGEIAQQLGTYPNKVRRDAKKLGIESKTRSEAQAIALKEGRHPHPTKGKGHDENTKIKISESVAENWDNLSEAEREAIRQRATEIWNNRDAEDIRKMTEAAREGVRAAAKHGSKLEKFLLKELMKNGYKVEFHKEQWVIRDRLQIDIFLPELNVAIEVDGPSHFEDIWGEENLQKNQQRDKEKTGLLLQKGICLIRIKQSGFLSKKYKRDVLRELLESLESIKLKFPEKGKRCIILGD